MFTDTASKDGQAGLNLRVATTASTPATPGPSTPIAIRSKPLDQLPTDSGDEEDFLPTPPARPSSTPFPKQEPLEGDIQCLRRLTGLDNDTSLLLSQTSYEHSSTDLLPQKDWNSQSRSHADAYNTPTLSSLPIEIHECILDHVFGLRAPASTRVSSAGSKVFRGWGSALRHCRRREVSELALVSQQWRDLVQERLYRHIKIKGTRDSVDQSTDWFHEHPNLCAYVKHIEIWFPVFQHRKAIERILRIPSDRDLLRFIAGHEDPGNSIPYPSPNNNCTLEETFRFVQLTFSNACILTLEGGDRKKPPMVKQFLTETADQSLPLLETITTLVCKGQWNLLRSNDDFQTVIAALPNVAEWHGSYAKPKSKSYLSMAEILPKLPSNLTHLNLCLESDFRREPVSPAFFRKVTLKTHFCAEMAKAMPALEHFAYTGRICHSFFDVASRLSNSRSTRLRSVDLTVKNVCRPLFQWNDGSGITDMAFIMAFEGLCMSAVRSLKTLAALEFLRIRFIDLGELQCCTLASIKG
jgi:hypothetical protein